MVTIFIYGTGKVIARVVCLYQARLGVDMCINKCQAWVCMCINRGYTLCICVRPPRLGLILCLETKVTLWIYL